jgi:hypothetical protein
LAFQLRGRRRNPNDPRALPQVESEENFAEDASRFLQALPARLSADDPEEPEDENVPRQKPFGGRLILDNFPTGRPLPLDGRRFNEEEDADPEEGRGAALVPIPNPPPSVNIEDFAREYGDAPPAVVPPQDELSRLNAQLKSQEATPVSDRNGRLKSALIGGLQEASAAARAQTASGRRADASSFAASLGAGAGGAVGGGVINPKFDEEQEKQAGVEKTKQQIGFELSRRKAAGDLEKQQAENAILKAKPGQDAAELKQKGDELTERTKNRKVDSIVSRYNSLKNFDPADRANAALLAEAAEVGISLPPKREGEKTSIHIAPDGRVLVAHRDADGNVSFEDGKDVGGKSLNVAKPATVKIPDTFYKGKNDQRMKDDAMARVLSNPAYQQQNQIRPEVLQAYGGDVERVYRAMRNDSLTPAQVFADPTKGAAFERDMAAARRDAADEAQEYDRYLDMTGRDSSKTTRVSLSAFEATYRSFKQALGRARNEKERQKLRDEYERALAGVRVVD